MGVLTCARYGCNNIMCDRWSSKYGYICDECFDELVSCGLGIDVDEFMDTEPNKFISDEKESAWNAYDNEFKRNNENG